MVRSRYAMATPRTTPAKSTRASSKPAAKPPAKTAAKPKSPPTDSSAFTGTPAQRIRALNELTAKAPPRAAAIAVSIFSTPERSWKLRAAAASALGGGDSPEVFQAICTALADPEQGVRDAAFGSLARSPHPDATALLLTHFDAGVSAGRSNNGKTISIYTLYQHVGLRQDPAVEARLLARVLADPPDLDAIRALGWSNDPALLARLVALVEHPVAGSSARSALVRRGGALAYDAMASLLDPARAQDSAAREVVGDVILSLWCNNDRRTADDASVNDPRWAELALYWIADEKDEIAKGAGIIVNQLRHRRLVPAMLAYLNAVLRKEVRRTRATAELVQALVELRDPRATSTLQEIVSSTQAGESAQYYALSALGALGDPATLPTLYALKTQFPDDKRLRDVIRSIERGSQ